MAWSEVTRLKYRRDGLRYASDLTDAEWSVIEPLLPRSRLGRPRMHSLRSILEAIFYLLATGCQWRALPRDVPCRSTVQSDFYRWRDDGTWQRVQAALVAHAHRLRGRPPSAGLIDSQSVKTTESGGPRGQDPGKKVEGRKRHIVADMQGLVLAVLVHPANIQDCHGAVPLLTALRRRFPHLRHIFADRVYRGDQLRDALKPTGPWTIEIVQRPPGVKGFQLLPRRWVVERTFAWLGRSRRLAKDYEASIASATAWLLLASIKLTCQRLARLACP